MSETRLMNYTVLRDAVMAWANSLAREGDNAKRHAETNALVAITSEDSEEAREARVAAMQLDGKSGGLQQGVIAFDELRQQLDQGLFDAKGPKI